MAFKFREEPGNPDSLLPLLVRSGLNSEKKNTPLYQCINGLISFAQNARDQIKGTLKVGDAIPASDITGVVAPINGGSFSGTYLPVGTLVTNLDSIGFNTAKFFRVGYQVHVSGLVTINPTAAGLWEGKFNLPILSYFLRPWDATGVATAINGEVATLVADITTFELFISGTATVTTQFQMEYQADYELIAQTVSP